MNACVRAVCGVAFLLPFCADLARCTLPQNWYASNPTNKTLRAVTYGQGRLVVVGDQGTIITSADGFRWEGITNRTSWAGSNIMHPYLSVAYGDGMFVAGGELTAARAFSSDGITWTNAGYTQTNFQENLHALAFADGRFVGMGDANRWDRYFFIGREGYAIESTGGSDFQFVGYITTNWLNALTYGAGMFVAVGNHGAILTSSNRYRWNSRTSPTTNNLRAITYTGARFIAGGEAATLITSIDGISWTTAAPPSFEIMGLASGDGAVVAVGHYAGAGRLHASPDGLSWPGNPSAYPQTLNAVAWLSEHFIAVGNNGLILQSDWRPEDRTNQWTKPASGNWQELQWSQGRLPGRKDSVALDNAGWKALAIDYATTTNHPESLEVLNLSVEAPVDSSNLLLLNYAGGTPLHVLHDLVLRPRGALLSYSSVLVADRLVVDGGVATLADQTAAWLSEVLVGQTLSGELNISNANVFIRRLTAGSNSATGVINHYAGSNHVDAFELRGNGYYNLGPGTLTTSRDVYIGSTAGASDFALAGGRFNAEGWVYLGSAAGTGRLLISSGAVQAPVIQILQGSFWQSGGSTVISSLEFPAVESRGPSSAVLDGGELRTTFVRIGLAGESRGIFWQQGGVHINTNTLSVWGGVTNSGIYTLAGGRLEADWLELLDGVFNQLGGTNTVRLFSAWGNVSLESGVMLVGSGDVGGGWWDDQKLFRQTGGTQIVTNDFGAGSFGTYEIAGGTLWASNITVAGPNGVFRRSLHGTITNPGTFTFYGGTLAPGPGSNSLGRLSVRVAFDIETRLSSIDFEPGAASVLRFQDSHTEAWDDGRLVITNWAGALNGGGADRLYVGTSATGLTVAQLAHITFSNPAGLASGSYAARILATGEVVPEAMRPALVWSRIPSGLNLAWDSSKAELLRATNVAGPYRVVTPQPAGSVTISLNGSSEFFILRPTTAAPAER